MEEEDFVQLYRRIGCYVEVTKAEVLVYPNGMTDNGCPKGLAQVYKNKLFENTAETKLSQTIDFSAVFNEICEPATIDIFDNTQLKLSDKK
ncbi:MAG: hypothetical protein ACLRSW_12675 [Christensenellaceae bacterium]